MRPFRHPAREALILDRVLYALADPIRLDIVRRLARQGEQACGDLDCGRAKSTMSHHFRVLRDSGVIETRHAGTTHMNTVRRADLDHRFPGLLDVILAQD